MSKAGPPFVAQYTSPCTRCSEFLHSGELGRADGQGGWMHSAHHRGIPVGTRWAMAFTFGCLLLLCVVLTVI